MTTKKYPATLVGVPGFQTTFQRSHYSTGRLLW